MSSRRPVVISVGGGKGGVGKSIVAGNVAIAVAELGFRTVLLDADLGAANQHTLFGIDRPPRSLQAFVEKEVAVLDEVAVTTGIPRLFLVPGIGAIPGAANLAHAQKLKLLRHVERLDADVVIIDVGAGVSFNVIDFFEAGDLRLVVTTPQLTALQNAHCFMKAAIHRGIRRRVESHPSAEGREAFEQCWRRSETERLSELRRSLRSIDPVLGGYVEQVTRGFATRLVGNMVEGPGQRRVIAALSRMAHDFLEVDVPAGANLGRSQEMHDSVTYRRPLMVSHPSHPDSVSLRALAEALVTEDVAAIRAARVAPPRPAAAASEAPEPDFPVEETLGAPLIAYLRRDQRVAVDIPVDVTSESRVERARVRDLSPSGALVAGVAGIGLGQRVTLGFPTQPACPILRGTVRHVAVGADHIGVELDPGSDRGVMQLVESSRGMERAS
jgi:flagellar biosynthesis protein FlhG